MGKGLAEFQVFAKDNDAVKKELTAAGTTMKAKELYAAIVKIAARQGFTFTVADIEAEIDNSTAKALKDEELSDEQLDLVAGGKGGGGRGAEAILCGVDVLLGQLLGYGNTTQQ